MDADIKACVKILGGWTSDISLLYVYTAGIMGSLLVFTERVNTEKKRQVPVLPYKVKPVDRAHQCCG